MGILYVDVCSVSASSHPTKLVTNSCSIFLGLAAYIILGSWVNYSQYGARGIDLLPHSDTIRDIPYILKDMFRRMQSGGSRGGYTAV